MTPDGQVKQADLDVVIKRLKFEQQAETPGSALDSCRGRPTAIFSRGDVLLSGNRFDGKMRRKRRLPT